MASDVKIHIKSVQKAGDSAEIDHTDADGRLTVSGDGRFILRFDTTDENGITATTVRSMEADRVTVIRRGLMNTKMEYDSYEPTPFIYSTPIGDLGFMLYTDEISLLLDEAPSLSLVMRYRLFSEGECVSENRIEITAV